MNSTDFCGLENSIFSGHCFRLLTMESFLPFGEGVVPEFQLLFTPLLLTVLKTFQ